MKDKLLNYIQQDLIGKRQSVTVSADDNLLTSGLIDSMGVMKLITFIEKEFGVKVPPQDMVIENFMSVNAISEYLTSFTAA